MRTTLPQQLHFPTCQHPASEASSSSLWSSLESCLSEECCRNNRRRRRYVLRRGAPAPTVARARAQGGARHCGSVLGLKWLQRAAPADPSSAIWGLLPVAVELNMPPLLE